MSDKLVLPFYRHDLKIDKNGSILENEIIEKVVHFTVERSGTYRFAKNEKVYNDLRGAFKALAKKAQNYPGTRFGVRMYYWEKSPNRSNSTELFDMCVDSKGKAKISYSFDRIFLCEIDTTNYSIRYEDEDENSENTLLLDWFPRKRNRKMSVLQERISSFERYNIQNIDFKGIVPDKEKAVFFNELEHCFQKISEVFPVSEFAPVKEIYFSNYKKAYGKYGQHKISLNLNAYDSIRDTIYHEYGHFLYDIGLFGTLPFTSYWNVDRTLASTILDTLLNKLSEGRTLKEIKGRAILRMRFQGKEPNLFEMENHQTKHEKYLLRDTEIFARFFASFMIYRDQRNGTSENYRLDFKEEELEAFAPLLLSFLKQILSDYREEKALSQK